MKICVLHIVPCAQLREKRHTQHEIKTFVHKQPLLICFRFMHSSCPENRRHSWSSTTSHSPSRGMLPAWRPPAKSGMYVSSDACTAERALYFSTYPSTTRKSTVEHFVPLLSRAFEACYVSSWCLNGPHAHACKWVLAFRCVCMCVYLSRIWSWFAISLWTADWLLYVRIYVCA